MPLSAQVSHYSQQLPQEISKKEHHKQNADETNTSVKLEMQCQ